MNALISLQVEVSEHCSSGSSSKAGGSGGLLSSRLVIFALVALGSSTVGGTSDSLLLEGGGDDVGGEGQLLNEVCYTLVSDGVVSPLPRENLLKEALRLE